MELSEVHLSKDELMPGEEIEGVCDHKKYKGSGKGTETVQLYLRDVTGSTARPVKQLKGLKRVTLQPGEEAKWLSTSGKTV